MVAGLSPMMVMRGAVVSGGGGSGGDGEFDDGDGEDDIAHTPDSEARAPPTATLTQYGSPVGSYSVIPRGFSEDPICADSFTVNFSVSISFTISFPFSSILQFPLAESIFLTFIIFLFCKSNSAPRIFCCPEESSFIFESSSCMALTKTAASLP